MSVGRKLSKIFLGNIRHVVEFLDRINSIALLNFQKVESLFFVGKENGLNPVTTFSESDKGCCKIAELNAEKSNLLDD